MLWRRLRINSSFLAVIKHIVLLKKPLCSRWSSKMSTRKVLSTNAFRFRATQVSYTREGWGWLFGFLKGTFNMLLNSEKQSFPEMLQHPLHNPLPSYQSCTTVTSLPLFAAEDRRQDWGLSQGLVPFPRPAPRAGALEWLPLCGSNEAPVSVSSSHLPSRVIFNKK